MSARLLRRSASRPARARRLPERRRPAARRSTRARAAAGRTAASTASSSPCRSRTRPATAPSSGSRPTARWPTASTGTPSSASSSSVRPQLAHLKIALLADWRLLDQGPAAARVPRARARIRAPTDCSFTACRRACVPRYYESRAGGRPADRDHVLLELAARGDRRGGRQRLRLHLPRFGVRQERDGRPARPQRARAGPPDTA